MIGTKIYLLNCLVIFTLSCTAQPSNSNNSSSSGNYVCLPCGRECDNEVLTAPGECKHCKMVLVKQSTVVFKSIDPKVMCDSLTNMKEVIVLDVRSPEEFEGKAQENFGRLKNAINIPVQQLETRLAELAAFKNKQIVVYCSHSRRSPMASHILTENGFTNVTNMLGGMSVLLGQKNISCMQN